MDSIKSPSPLVNFLLVGAQKSGTTAIDSCLRQHPEICMAIRKEVHFFDDDARFAGPVVDYDYYHSFFKVGAGHKAVGEATPVYMYWHDSPRRIWHYNSGMKIIVVLRNPIDRAYSHWNMQVNRGKELRSFRDAIDGEESACRTSLPFQSRDCSYLDRGHYVSQIRRLRMYFPLSQLLFIKFEEWVTLPAECLDKIFSFLGVSRLESAPDYQLFAANYDERMAYCDRHYVCAFYEFEVRQIERMLGWDCSDWLKA